MSKFVVKFDGIDGKSTKRFSSLEAAGAYVKDRFQGIEYVRAGNVFGSDYGVYTLVGFDLADLGKFYTEYEYDGERDVPVRGFAFYKEFGGDYDKALDPKGEGDYRISQPLPIWDDRDFVAGWRYATLAVAKTLDEAFDKLALVNAANPDPNPDFPAPLVIGPNFTRYYNRSTPSRAGS